MRVQRLPADVVARLRQITPAILEQKLAVLAQWQLKDGTYAPVPPGPNFSKLSGVRRKDDGVQMGLRSNELSRLQRQLTALLKRIDRGDITTF